jgi:hypothetical protein
VFFMVASPFFLLQSASYFAHASGLLFGVLFVFFAVGGIERRACHDWLWPGLCGSMALLIRPLDQLAVLAPLGGYVLLLVLGRRLAVRHAACLGLGHGVGGLLAYNWAQTGHPLTMGYHVGYGQPLFALHLPGLPFVADYILQLCIWAFPFVPLLALLQGLWLAKASARPDSPPHWDVLLLLVFLSAVLGYAGVPFHPLAGCGPRYYYASWSALALLAAKGAVTLAAGRAPRPTAWRSSPWASVRR